jgi:hypothetical protein
MPFQIILVYNVQIYNVLYATYRIKLFCISIVLILNGIILALCRFYHNVKSWCVVKKNNSGVKYFNRQVSFLW